MIMKKKDNLISLDFMSDLKYTEFCVLVFGYIRNLLNIKEDDFFQTEISLREVINNAILHGNKADIEKRVQVTFQWTKTRLRLTIKDQNPDKVNFDEINERLKRNDLLSHNGRGIMIMKSYMDKVEFHPSTTGTKIILEKRL